MLGGHIDEDMHFLAYRRSRQQEGCDDEGPTTGRHHDSEHGTFSNAQEGVFASFERYSKQIGMV